MPRPRIKVEEEMEAPTFEEQLRDAAHWIDSHTHGGKFAVVIMPGMAQRVARWLEAYADERDAA